MADKRLIRPIVYPSGPRAEHRTSSEIQAINLPKDNLGYNETQEAENEQASDS